MWSFRSVCMLTYLHTRVYVYVHTCACVCCVDVMAYP